MERPELETYWIILGTDGRHVTLGRRSDPSPQEIDQAEAALCTSGEAGWLALMKGGYYLGPETPTLIMVRTLGSPTRSWADAVAAFEAVRKTRINTIPE